MPFSLNFLFGEIAFFSNENVNDIHMSLVYFLYFFFKVGSQFLDQRWYLCLLQWKHGVLTTGLPVKSQDYDFFGNRSISEIWKASTFLTAGKKKDYLFVVQFFIVYKIVLLKETHVPQCSSQHCLQQPLHGSNLDVHQQMNG